MNRHFLRSGKAISRIRSLNPHKVPAGAANCCIESRGGKFFRQCPGLVEWVPDQIQIVRENALRAQEN